MTLYIQNRSMTDTLSIAEARRNLPTLVRDAENGKTVTLTRRGTPVAVLVGRRQYAQLTAGPRSFAKAYGQFAQTNDLAGLALDPDALFSDTRDSMPGRSVGL